MILHSIITRSCNFCYLHICPHSFSCSKVMGDVWNVFKPQIWLKQLYKHLSSLFQTVWLMNLNCFVNLRQDLGAFSTFNNGIIKSRHNPYKRKLILNRFLVSLIGHETSQHQWEHTNFASIFPLYFHFKSNKIIF